MKIKANNNKLFVNEILVNFDYNIESVIEFEESCIVLLMGETIPDNNIIAIGTNGEIIWNISEIIRFNYPEAYFSLNKEDENSFGITSYNGVRFLVDLKTLQVIKKEITK